jgi:hypothetical protein
MASILKVDELRGIVSAGDITVTVGATATMSLQDGTAKVWCNFNGTTFASRTSLNVSSESDNGTGDYHVTATNAFSTIDNASTTGAASYNTTSVSPGITSPTQTSTTQIDIEVVNVSGTKVDRSAMQLITMGDLA